MRNTTILLAVVAMLVWAAPVHGASRTWDGDGDGTYWGCDTNWTSDTEPTTGDAAVILSDNTVTLNTAAVSKYVKLGLNVPTYGCLIVETGGSLISGNGSSWMSVGYKQSQVGVPDCTVVQEAGSGLVKLSRLELGTPYDTRLHGHGMYTVKTRNDATDGKVIDFWKSMYLGFKYNSLHTDHCNGKGIFVIDCSGVANSGPDDTDIYTAVYVQGVQSTLKVMLDAAGEVGQINVSGNATLMTGGHIVVDDSSWTQVKDATVDILVAGGTLSNSATVTGTDWVIDTSGGVPAGHLRLKCTVPEPATMSLLVLGGVGLLIRRRRNA